MTKTASQIYQIKVTLDDTRPPVWRRLQVSGNTTLLKLHDILQIVMGWENYHLHIFRIDGVEYGDPADDELGLHPIEPDSRYKLSEIIYTEGQRFNYEYDFGDGWQHTLLVEKVLPPAEGVRYPICLKGKLACPPEDVGGPFGYQLFLEALADPRHPDHNSLLEWAGEEFDPQDFDVIEVNAELRRMGRGMSTELANDWSGQVEQPESDPVKPEIPWLEHLSPALQAVAESLSFRRDIISLLTYLRDNKVTGTASTGNLPLKAVRGICAQFVDPPKLEDVIGDHVYPVRSEYEVWPLYFRHVLASMLGLVSGGMGRRWRVTPMGEKYLQAPAALQVWMLYVTWWTQVNWAIAIPWDYGGGYLPPGFRQTTLRQLNDLPTGEQVPFKPFADRVIEAGKLVWRIEDREIAHYILQATVERAVARPLSDFGVLSLQLVPHESLGGEYTQLSAIQLTPFGRSLVDATKDVEMLL